MEERKGVVTIGGKPVTLLGREIKVGDKAPDFTIITKDSEPFDFKSTSGKIRLISVFLSLDTGICDTQARRFNEETASFGDKVEILNISVDLPYTQKRWCGAAGIDKIKLLTDHRDVQFGEAYGVLVKGLRVLARAIFVIDQDDVVKYVEYLPEIGSHPDYDKAIQAVKNLL